MATYNELNGLTMTFGTSTALTSAIINLKLPEVTAKEIETTTIISTVETSVASALKNQGEVTFTTIYDPAIAYPTYVGLTDETITVTLPKLNGASANGRKLIFSGHITKFSRPSAENGTRATCDLTIKVNSTLAETAEA
jgi:hypothetical protein